MQLFYRFIFCLFIYCLFDVHITMNFVTACLQAADGDSSEPVKRETLQSVSQSLYLRCNYSKLVGYCAEEDGELSWCRKEMMSPRSSWKKSVVYCVLLYAYCVPGGEVCEILLLSYYLYAVFLHNELLSFVCCFIFFCTMSCPYLWECVPVSFLCLWMSAVFVIPILQFLVRSDLELHL